MTYEREAILLAKSYHVRRETGEIDVPVPKPTFDQLRELLIPKIYRGTKNSAQNRDLDSLADAMLHLHFGANGNSAKVLEECIYTILSEHLAGKSYESADELKNMLHSLSLLDSRTPDLVEACMKKSITYAKSSNQDAQALHDISNRLQTQLTALAELGYKTATFIDLYRS